MLLKQWAKENGISYWTALRWFKQGKMPVPTIQPVKHGSIVVTHNAERAEKIRLALYARVSSADQKEDAARQMERLRAFAAGLGRTVEREVLEIGSGLNGRRPKLKELLENSSFDILVEHRDRLARFGVEYVESTLKASGRKLMVMNETETKLDLVQDFIDVVTCMCARIYGKRSAVNRAKEAVKAAAFK